MAIIFDDLTGPSGEIFFDHIDGPFFGQIIEDVTSVSSAAVYGSHTLANVAARGLGPVGNLGSAAAYGSHTIGSSGSIQYLDDLSGVASAAVYGTHALANVAARTIGPISGVGSAAAYGTILVEKAVPSIGVPSAALYGTFTISSGGAEVLGLNGQGVTTSAVYGAHTLAKAQVPVIPPDGLASAAVYGSHAISITGNVAVPLEGLPSSAVYGDPVIAHANQFISMPSIPSAARRGIPRLLGGAEPEGNGLAARCRWRRGSTRGWT